jgi:hypothetical protein
VGLHWEREAYLRGERCGRESRPAFQRRILEGKPLLGDYDEGLCDNNRRAIFCRE